MKIVTLCLLLVSTAAVPGVLCADTVDAYIERAMNYRDSGDIEKALGTMLEAVGEHPENATCHAYLGLLYGIMAGQASDYMKAGEYSAKSFELLDKAVSLDPEDPKARLYRGLMGVKVPEFLGKLQGGIADLEHIQSIRGKSPDSVDDNDMLTSYELLGEGYIKSGDTSKAESAWKRVIEMAPGTKAAERAQAEIERIASAAAGGEEKPEISSEEFERLLAAGREAYGTGDFEKAEAALEKALSANSESVEANRLMALTLAGLGEKGYDGKIAEDTDYRTNLVFRSMSYLDKAVSLDPDNLELRLVRGIFGIMFPFFLQKHEQGVADLEIVLKSEAPDSMKAEAMYMLGVAHQRKAMSYWIEVATKYSGTEAAGRVLDGMRPSVARFDPSSYKVPVLVIDFVMGFRDELPPQTAVWIEDRKGNHIKTVYVSGFSGFAKDVQVVLPVFAEITNYDDVDAVTGASIDVGHHIFVWDLNDRDGERAKKGEYVVKVEMSWWPSMMYELASTAIEIGKKERTSVAPGGKLIPSLEVRYLPKL